MPQNVLNTHTHNCFCARSAGQESMIPEAHESVRLVIDGAQGALVFIKAHDSCLSFYSCAVYPEAHESMCLVIDGAQGALVFFQLKTGNFFVNQLCV